MDEASNYSDAMRWYAVGGNSQKSGGKLRTLRGFSTGAYKKMYKGCERGEAGEAGYEGNTLTATSESGEPPLAGKQCYKEYKMFHEYYGDFDYADKFVMAALQGTSTNFSRGRGNADFAPADAQTRLAAARTGTLVHACARHVVYA